VHGIQAFGCSCGPCPGLFLGGGFLPEAVRHITGAPSELGYGPGHPSPYLRKAPGTENEKRDDDDYNEMDGLETEGHILLLNQP